MHVLIRTFIGYAYKDVHLLEVMFFTDIPKVLLSLYALL